MCNLYATADGGTKESASAAENKAAAAELIWWCWPDGDWRSCAATGEGSDGLEGGSGIIKNQRLLSFEEKNILRLENF